MAFPKPTLVKLTKLEEAKKEHFKMAQLYKLYIVMQRTINEDMAYKAIQNYEKSMGSTTIKGVKVHALKDELARRL